MPEDGQAVSGSGPGPGPGVTAPGGGGAVHRRLTLFLQVILLMGVGLAIAQGRWLPAASTFAVVVVTLAPRALGRRLQVAIPPEFELLAVVFIYASLFLGEVQGYYLRFWWWDALLHTGSGFLLGDGVLRMGLSPHRGHGLFLGAVDRELHPFQSKDLLALGE